VQSADPNHGKYSTDSQRPRAEYQIVHRTLRPALWDSKAQVWHDPSIHTVDSSGVLHLGIRTPAKLKAAFFATLNRLGYTGDGAMLSAAKAKTTPVFPLAADLCENEIGFVRPNLAQTPHRSLAAFSAPCHQAIAFSKPLHPPGLPTCLYDSGRRSRCTGKERDTETASSATQANDYFGARYYSSSQGRFTSPDWSAKPQPIPYAVLNDPQTLNLYAYVRNNPLSRMDPDGHIDCSGKNAQLVGCQVIAQWNADHGVHSSSQGRTTMIVHSNGTLEQRTGNIAYRDNNPGDLRPYDFAKEHGAIGEDHPVLKGGKKDPVGFAVFENSAEGEAALRALLATPGVQSRSIAEEMQKFAPAGDSNDPTAYAASLGRALGVDVSLSMSKLTSQQVDAFVEKVKQREGFCDPNGTSEIIK